MATIDREHKPFSNPFAESSGSHRRSPSGKRTKKVRTAKKRLGTLVRVGRTLPRMLELEYKAHPGVVLVATSAASFGLGALFGSKLGRLAVAASIPYAIRRIFESEIGEELGQIAREFIHEQEAALS